ncbi:thiaminase II [soil metagenome]|jgi:thiaminase/transcriptional activator TenA
MDSRSLWAASHGLAEACRHHPFVTGMADGSLDRAVFQHYVGQDAFFLEAFAKAYALGLAKAADLATMQRFKALLDGAMDERDLHSGYAERWDVDLHPEPTPATRAYTDFLLSVATLEPAGHLCAAMTPCMRLYAWLGQQLQSITAPESPYLEWVNTYADPSFDDLAKTMEALLDDLGGDPSVIERHYTTAMELELAFFDSALRRGVAL